MRERMPEIEEIGVRVARPWLRGHVNILRENNSLHTRIRAQKFAALQMKSSRR